MDGHQKLVEKENKMATFKPVLKEHGVLLRICSLAIAALTEVYLTKFHFKLLSHDLGSDRISKETVPILGALDELKRNDLLITARRRRQFDTERQVLAPSRCYCT